MEREAAITPKDLLIDATIGRRPAYEWAESKLSTLKRKYGLRKFNADFNDLEVIEEVYSEGVVAFTGLEEIDNEEVGFIAGFIDGELKMISVFANLRGRFARFLRTGYKEQFNEWGSKREDFETDLENLLSKK
ncbi:MAG: hypothetical protein ACC618_00220 [Patescibacteria group bacterium]